MTDRGEASLHLFADNEDLTAADYTKTTALIDTIRDLQRRAKAYVASRGLDPEVFLPGNVWATIARGDIIGWSYDFVNYAKALSPFSGFYLMMWGRHDVPADSDFAIDAGRTADFYGRFFGGQISREQLPPMLEREFDLSGRMRRTSPFLIAEYEKLVDRVPERYRIRLEKRGGEIGILHRGRLLNPDLLSFQTRMNALFGSGVLQRLEDAIASRGSANYAEIGPGAAQFAKALRDCFEHRLNVFLIDLPMAMANGCAYLCCTAGPDAIAIVTPETATALHKPFVYVANHLLPAYERHLPPFDLVHNANSLNEMTDGQIHYYLSFVRAHLATGGSFHLSGLFKTHPDHRDVIAAAASRFPNHHIYDQPTIGEVTVIDPLHMVCYPAES